MIGACRAVNGRATVRDVPKGPKDTADGAGRSNSSPPLPSVDIRCSTPAADSMRPQAAGGLADRPNGSGCQREPRRDVTAAWSQLDAGTHHHGAVEG